MQLDRKPRSRRTGLASFGLTLGVAATLAVSACGSSGSSGSAPGGSSGGGASGGGASGGGNSNAAQTATVGGWDFNTLDPGATVGFLGPELPMVQPLYGALFDPPATSGGAYVPDLATSYSYAKDLKSVTITLRSGVTFQDGTPFNAAAIVWNINRYAGAESPDKQWYSDIASATATGADTVKVSFTHPDATFISMLAYTSGGLFSSPAAFKSAGAAKYGLHAVGAGPFEVSSFTPGQTLSLVPFPKYWAASKVKLTSLKYVNTPVDASVAYQDLASGSIDSLTLGGTSAPANVLQQAQGNSAISMVPGPDNLYLFLALNSSSKPFSNPVARQAIAYCTDRNALATAISPGFLKPAFIAGGSGTLYYPFGGATGAASAYPYAYNAAKAKALAAQLGGLKFTLINFGGLYDTISNALAQSWQACGINAQVSTVTGPALEQAFATGGFQMAFTVEGGLSNPIFYRSFQQLGTPQGAYTTAPLHSAIPGLVTQLYETTNTSQLNSLFTSLYTDINTEAATIPLVSGPNYSLSSKCLTGINLNGFGANYAFASKTC
jgi:peptide/nickel transport system substrate-binding protein